VPFGPAERWSILGNGSLPLPSDAHLRKIGKLVFLGKMPVDRPREEMALPIRRMYAILENLFFVKMILFLLFWDMDD
jgi:hypothetical protein